MLASSVRNYLLALEKRIQPMRFRSDVWLRPVVVLVNTLLVVALAYALAELVASMLWNRLPLPEVKVVAVSGSSSEPVTTVGSNDYAAVGALHLFGRQEATLPVEAPPPPVAATPLNLRLVGVFFSERGGKALALIAEGSGVERSYRVGEQLPGGALLTQVQRDNVTVTRDGQVETLHLPRLEESRASAAEPPAPMPMEAPAPSPPMPVEVPAESDAVPEQSINSNGPQVIDATEVAKRLREASDQPQALQDIAFASPYLHDGQFVGFRLRPGRERQLMGQLGFNNGDVITEVNGTRLNNPRQGVSLLRELRESERVSMRVLRGGAEIPLVFSLGPTIK